RSPRKGGRNLAPRSLHRTAPAVLRTPYVGPRPGPFRGAVPAGGEDPGPDFLRAARQSRVPTAEDLCRNGGRRSPMVTLMDPNDPQGLRITIAKLGHMERFIS